MSRGSRVDGHEDISANRRGGKRSGSGPGGRTKQQLYADAERKGIKGRSTMTKAQLEKAVLTAAGLASAECCGSGVCRWVGRRQDDDGDDMWAGLPRPSR